MGRSLNSVLPFKAYQNQAGVLVRNYVLADPYIPYTSIFAGILTCKLVCHSFQIDSDFLHDCFENTQHALIHLQAVVTQYDFPSFIH